MALSYTAATLTAATRPDVITLGRVDRSRADRTLHPRTWWWGVLVNAVHRWWLRTCRTWTVRPISTPQMLALQAVSRDPLRYLITLASVLHAVFPTRRRDRWCGRPVRLILSLPDELRSRVLRTLVTLPGSTTDQSRVDDDPLAHIREAQRRAVRGASTTGTPSLAAAALTVRAHLGESWYYNPARWSTSDGYAPFVLAWLEFAGLEAVGARRRLEIADGFSLLHSKNPRHAIRQLHAQAFPREVH